MKRPLEGGYELDDDPARVDIDVVVRYLSEESYWAKGRSRDKVVTTFENASRVAGAYDVEGKLVGYGRAASDEVVFAYLCDIFVLDGHKGHGIGTEIVRELVDNGPQRDLRWLLGTGDAHDFYRQFGFKEPSFRIMERPGPKFEP